MTLDWSWFGSMSIKVYGIEFRSILVKSGDKIQWTSQQSSPGSLQLNYHNGSIIESHYWDDSIIITILKEECGIPWKDLFEWLYNHLSSFPLSIVLFLQRIVVWLQNETKLSSAVLHHWNPINRKIKYDSASFSLCDCRVWDPVQLFVKYSNCGRIELINCSSTTLRFISGTVRQLLIPTQLVREGERWVIRIHVACHLGWVWIEFAFSWNSS